MKLVMVIFKDGIYDFDSIIAFDIIAIGYWMMQKQTITMKV